MSTGASPSETGNDPVAVSSPTLFHPAGKTPERTDSKAGWSLSPELRGQVTRRLRLIGITYTLAFFLAGMLPAILFGQLREWAASPTVWVPVVTAMAVGLLVAAVASTTRLSWRAKLHIGLAFEVLGCYGIAIAQYTPLPPDLRSQPQVLHVLSPSWVAIWMLFYSVVVPAPPRKALVALLLSASAAPIVIWASLRMSGLDDLVPLPMFLVHHVLPYAICVGMAYAGARVVYNLGSDVALARALGSYQLTERLGRGGMGEVWRASHRLLARPAAIKFIRPDAIAGVSPSEAKLMLTRFEREARSTASLTSEHTVDLYDYGVSDDGTFYYVMELLDGLDSDALVRLHGALPPSRAVHLLGQMCESLDEAHGKGLIHRDVKPANVYVCRSGNRFDFVKVLDFGLVMHRNAPDADTRLTMPDQAVGTPQFMAPEMARGKAPDARSDLYAVGCVAYWLVTGRPVFTGENLYDVVSKHLQSSPDPPSRHAPHALPPELDALVLACLAKDPDERPRTARELGRGFAAIPLADHWGDDEAEAWWRARTSAPRSA